jgi:hypothetical protein
METDTTNAVEVERCVALLIPAARAVYDGDEEACGEEEHANGGLPENWDRDGEGLVFTHRLLSAADLTDEQRQLNTQLYTTIKTAGVHIREVTRTKHPCRGQMGLYASTTLIQSTRLLRYTGVARRRIGDGNESAANDSDYLFGLSSRWGEAIDIDAKLAGNESRCIRLHHHCAPALVLLSLRL